MQRTGCRLVSTGRARPVLTNGLFRYKRKWGYAVRPDAFQPRAFGVRIANTRGGRAFLARNPLVLESASGLVGVALIGREETAGSKDVKRAARYFSTRGLARLVLLSERGFAADVDRQATPGLVLRDCAGSLLVPLESGEEVPA